MSDYVGSELSLFAAAETWRRYWSATIRAYLGTDVLEVGAGLGSTVRELLDSDMSWLAVEPDVALADQIRGWTADQDIANAAVLTGTLADVPTESTYDSILYIDVLEHIDEDSLEVRRAFDHLRPGGRLIILVPAHQFLYSPFDASIGHFRRYNKSSLTRLQPPHSMQERLIYLDSVGLLASLTNKLLLRSAMPTAGQIRLWDRVLVRGSKVLDPLLAHSLGKSLLVVWRRPL